jgi:hypothetical protein
MRVNHVAKATGSKKRPWPSEGKRCMKCSKPIMKGEPYKWAKGRYSWMRIACGNCQFSRSDLTDSIKGAIYDAFDEAFKELEEADETTDFSSIADTIAEAVREVEEQYRSTAEEYFSGGGPNAEYADECDSVASELESIQAPDIDDFETWVENNKDGTTFDSYEVWLEGHLAEIEGGKVEGEGEPEPETEEELRAMYDAYIEEECRPLYDEYVQEEVQGFVSEIESADTL